MAKNAIYILSDETRLKRFKKDAFAHAQTFSIDNILPRYEAFYEQTLKKNDVGFVI